MPGQAELQTLRAFQKGEKVGDSSFTSPHARTHEQL